MEHCPNCGASGRAGAKFCTTCGYRFPGADEESSPDEPTQPVAAESNGDERAADEPVAPTVTWPAPPAAETAGEAGWPRETVTVAETESDGEESDELLSTTWPSDKADFWPSPFAPTAAPALGDNDDTETAMNDEPSPGAAAASQEALTRAERLAEELRVALASVRVTAGPDLSGVISDLEVAATPPGALEATDLASLREALLSARERPRDIDTMLDLSHRLDGIVALMIAYDRAIAAIERSLAVLKPDEDLS